MSTINLEKDDLATQEMLSMMGELPDNAQDDILDLDDIDALMAQVSAEKETTADISVPITNEIAQLDDNEDNSDDDFDIDALLNSVTQNNPSTSSLTNTALLETLPDSLEDEFADSLNDEIEIESTSTPTAQENINVTDDIDDLDDMDVALDEAHDDSLAKTDVENSLTTDSPGLVTSDLALDDKTNEDYELLEMTLAETSTNQSSNQSTNELTHEAIPAVAELSQDNTNAEDRTLIEQTAHAVSIMETAIGIDQHAQQLAQQVVQSAQEATQLALATTAKAQASAERTQKAIEATFAAAERAFNTAQKAGYSLNETGLENEFSLDELTQQLDVIREKNQRLKEINLSIEARLADLK
ncbi:hypothetical protein [Thiomicrorhabdus aquaedulcis]|uniref:hypothetical protein n=1 Tax=Thiomicrorhabdus aquaedulcis TaxID=2211106 RepID=UPI000FD7B42F|nr:hypothetical protein [Thiomicrorhabdus aquaedulcis]